MTGQREEGTVKHYNGEKGFGFISRRGGEDVFVNKIALERAGLEGLSVGDRVSFTVRHLPDGKTRAENLAVIAGGAPAPSQGGRTPVGPAPRLDTSTAFQFGPDYLSEGYFVERDGKRYLRSEVLDSLAIDVAKVLGNADMKPNQLRRFFGKARGIEAKLDRDKDFEAIKAHIYAFKRDVAYQVGRKVVPEVFQQFITRNVELAVVDARSFREGFLQHFESVVAYFVYYFRD